MFENKSPKIYQIVLIAILYCYSISILLHFRTFIFEHFTQPLHKYCSAQTAQAAKSAKLFHCSAQTAQTANTPGQPAPCIPHARC